MRRIPLRIAIVQHDQERERDVGRELEHLEIRTAHYAVLACSSSTTLDSCRIVSRGDSIGESREVRRETCSWSDCKSRARKRAGTALQHDRDDQLGHDHDFNANVD